MARTALHSRLLMILVLAQVLTVVGQYGRIVWCVGENGHAAVEPAHHAVDDARHPCEHGCDHPNDDEPERCEHTCIDLGVSDQPLRCGDDGAALPALTLQALAAAAVEPVRVLVDRADPAPMPPRRPPPDHLYPVRTVVLRL